MERLLRDAGLEGVSVRATARVTRPGEYYQTFLLTLTQLVREDILAAHALTADELYSYIESLRAHLAAPGTLTKPTHDVASLGPDTPLNIVSGHGVTCAHPVEAIASAAPPQMSALDELRA